MSRSTRSAVANDAVQRGTRDGLVASLQAADSLIENMRIDDYSSSERVWNEMFALVRDDINSLLLPTLALRIDCTQTTLFDRVLGRSGGDVPLVHVERFLVHVAKRALDADEWQFTLDVWLRQRLESGTIDVVEELLRVGGDLTRIELDAVARGGDVTLMQRALAARDGAADARQLAVALDAAARGGQKTYRLLRFLLEQRSVEVSMERSQRLSIMHKAILGNSYDSVTYLLSKRGFSPPDTAARTTSIITAVSAKALESLRALGLDDDRYVQQIAFSSVRDCAFMFKMIDALGSVPPLGGNTTVLTMLVECDEQRERSLDVFRSIVRDTSASVIEAAAPRIVQRSLRNADRTQFIFELLSTGVNINALATTRGYIHAAPTTVFEHVVSESDNVRLVQRMIDMGNATVTVEGTRIDANALYDARSVDVVAALLDNDIVSLDRDVVVLSLLANAIRRSDAELIALVDKKAPPRAIERVFDNRFSQKLFAPLVEAGDQYTQHPQYAVLRELLRADANFSRQRGTALFRVDIADVDEQLFKEIVETNYLGVQLVEQMIVEGTRFAMLGNVIVEMLLREDPTNPIVLYLFSLGVVGTEGRLAERYISQMRRDDESFAQVIAPMHLPDNVAPTVARALYDADIASVLRQSNNVTLTAVDRRQIEQAVVGIETLLQVDIERAATPQETARSVERALAAAAASDNERDRKRVRTQQQHNERVVSALARLRVVE